MLSAFAGKDASLMQKLHRKKQSGFHLSPANPFDPPFFIGDVGEIKFILVNTKEPMKYWMIWKTIESHFPPVCSKAHVSYLAAWLHFEVGEFDKSLIFIKQLHGLENKEAPVYECELAMPSSLVFYSSAEEKLMPFVGFADLKQSRQKEALAIPAMSDSAPSGRMLLLENKLLEAARLLGCV